MNNNIKSLIPLNNVLYSDNKILKKYTIRALVSINDDSSVDILMNYIDIIADDYEYFTSKNFPSVFENVFIRSLNEFGGDKMAEAFLNSDNKTLQNAGKSWARQHNKMIMPTIKFNHYKY